MKGDGNSTNQPTNKHTNQPPQSKLQFSSNIIIIIYISAVLVHHFVSKLWLGQKTVASHVQIVIAIHTIFCSLYKLTSMVQINAPAVHV